MREATRRHFLQTVLALTASIRFASALEKRVRNVAGNGTAGSSQDGVDGRLAPVNPCSPNGNPRSEVTIIIHES